MWKTSMYDTTKVTIELRDIVDNGTDIWNFDYPSYYEGEDKTKFEQKVIDHYYLRQIGQETVGRFLHCFRTRIREIMPRYLEMYKTVELMNNLDNPFDNVDIVETFEEESTGTSTSSSTAYNVGISSTETTENLKHIFSDTPQNTIINIENHMTEATKDDRIGVNTGKTESDTGADSEGESKGTTKHTLTKKGNQGVNTYAHDIIEFRQSIIDVDIMIINDLNDLFLGVY